MTWVRVGLCGCHIELLGTTKEAVRPANVRGSAVPSTSSGPGILRCQAVGSSQPLTSGPKECPGAGGAYAGAGRRGLGESLLGERAQRVTEALLTS